MKIYLADPRGFCAGVDRAIEIVGRALELFGAPIYVKHEIVHNDYVVNDLRNRGAVFIENLDEVPEGATLVFSAHGVSQEVRRKADERKFRVFDATCPLVTKVHMEVARYARSDKEVILIGHAGHPEVEGTLGQYRSEGGDIYLVESVEDVAALEVKSPEALTYVTQTTLSVNDTQVIKDALKEKFPEITGPRRDDICYATQNRQDAVKTLAQKCEVVLVVGSKTSSNSNRLSELAKRLCGEAYLVDGAGDLKQAWFEGKQVVGVTAGASAPEVLVQEVISQLRAWGGGAPETLNGVMEKVQFTIPKPLREKVAD